ncbi:MAG: cupin domain-containing protein [Sphingomonas sp.]|uniref:cupin domain-containing protein n=1 Tax=Sphingomonas sp. TaxID=28214 RepID=UPI002620F9F0|nr:cupin domain-containing protein [Sphingomonas sp.]MDK2770024.1 cupin domain-containing protein [Sphingomonas sp.]
MSKVNKGPVRRVVTGHDAQGRAVFVEDARFDPVDVATGDAAMCLLWTAPDLPVDNNDPTDGRTRDAGTTLRGGSVIRTTDMYPGEASPFHRTSSLDYGIVVSGHVELELDDGATVLLGAGDVVIQRGTIHLWRNPSPTETCRIVFILTEALPVEVDGLPLPDIHP